jgi:hypothetical protein
MNWWEVGFYDHVARKSARLLDGSGYYLTDAKLFIGWPAVYMPGFVDPQGLPWLLLLPEYFTGDTSRFPYGLPVEPDRHDG